MESIAEVCLHAVYGYNVPIDDLIWSGIGPIRETVRAKMMMRAVCLMLLARASVLSWVTFVKDQDFHY
jgi:hypothetical protein